jgi:methyl-accepting chemotaxis protein
MAFLAHVPLSYCFPLQARRVEVDLCGVKDDAKAVDAIHVKPLRISQTIYLLVGLGLLTGALASTFLLIRCSMISSSYTLLINGEVAQAQQIRVLQVTFKKQVQAWKDILLRGKDDKALAQYTDEFRQLDSKLQTLAAELNSDLKDEQARRGLQGFIQQHALLTSQYEAALREFHANRDSVLADTALKGKDRPPTDSLDGVAERLTGLSQTLPAQEATQLRHTQMILAFTLALIWLSLGVWSVVFVRSLGVRLANCLEFVRGIAGGDLTTESISLAGNDELDELVGAMTEMRDRLRDIVQSMQQAAEHLSSATVQMTVRSTQNADNAQNQSKETGQIAAATQEMAATIGEISQNASTAADLSRVSAETAQTGGMVMRSAAATMEKIAHASEAASRKMNSLAQRSGEIGKVVSAIQEISEQTNLLALNAAIEAARAGESGRGFAVVAGEVRRLAERTKQATLEISATINSIQEETASTLGTIQESRAAVEVGLSETAQAREGLDQIIEVSKKVERQIELIASAATEQTAASGEISESANHISQLSNESSHGADETEVALKSLALVVNDLNAMIQQFQLVSSRTHVFKRFRGDVPQISPVAASLA